MNVNQRARVSLVDLSRTQIYGLQPGRTGSGLDVSSRKFPRVFA